MTEETFPYEFEVGQTIYMTYYKQKLHKVGVYSCLVLARMQSISDCMDDNGHEYIGHHGNFYQLKCNELKDFNKKIWRSSENLFADEESAKESLTK